MAEKSKIAWCDSTVNFLEGCTKVSAGCANCYAEARDRRFTGGAHWGKGAPRRKSKSAVKDALRLNRLPWVCDECGEAFAAAPVTNRDMKCYECGKRLHRRRIFSLSLGDWLDPEIPIEWLAEMLNTIRRCDQVQWLLCTKRPELWQGRMFAAWPKATVKTADWIMQWAQGGQAPSNICLLTSVENQAMADKRIPELLRIPAQWRGLSCEPLLGPVQLEALRIKRSGVASDGIDWVIIGGESGPNARPCNVAWVRSLVQQGQAAGVSVFVKQLGTNAYVPAPFGPITHSKGGDPSEWPSDLRIQQWPTGL